LNTDFCIPDPYVFGTLIGVYFKKLAFEWFDFLETELIYKKSLTVLVK